MEIEALQAFLPYLGIVEVGGVALVTAIILILVMIPHLIQRRTAIMESREGDRFSPDLRLVDAFSTPPQSDHHMGSCRILSQRTGSERNLPLLGSPQGDIMVASQRPMQSSTARQRAHEMAQLRARRAARRSAEFASGQRRMAAAGVFTALTLLAGLLVAFSVSSSWSWVLLPITGLVATLALSRVATVRAERADAADRERMSDLLRYRHAAQSSLSSYEETATTSPTSSTFSSDAEPVEPQLAPGKTNGSDELGSGSLADQVIADDREPEEAQVLSSTPSEGKAASSDEADRQIRVALEGTWTPRPLPMSRYSQRRSPRAQVVHADTDLRGIPRVPSSVPARPIAPTIDPQARSTEDIVASVPLAFNLDDILEARRA